MTVMIRRFGSPEQTTSFDHGRVESATVGGSIIRRNTFEPGWRWSNDVKPIAKTDPCQVHHVGYIVSGRLGVATEDGQEAEIGPGETYEIQPGHEGWVVGDEAVISVEFVHTDDPAS
jgi:hypothetical protein